MKIVRTLKDGTLLAMSERAAVIAKLRRIYTPLELQSLRDRIFYPAHLSKSRVLRAAARLGRREGEAMKPKPKPTPRERAIAALVENYSCEMLQKSYLWAKSLAGVTCHPSAIATYRLVKEAIRRASHA